MKRVILYSVLFGVSLIVATATITSLNWIFWISLAVLFFSSYRMEKDYRMCEGEIDDLFGTDEDFE